MATEVTITLWTDANLDAGDAANLARDAADSVFRATALNTAVVAADVDSILPAEVETAAVDFETDETTKPVVLADLLVNLADGDPEAIEAILAQPTIDRVARAAVDLLNE